MRTDSEIIARAKEIEDSRTDFLGTRIGDLIQCLPKEDAKPFLKPDADISVWKQAPRDEDSVKNRMLDYMPFAWRKANDHRGLSATRSIEHMSAWLWLLGHDEASNQILDYDQYGKPWLRAICEAFGWDWKQWDDGRWVNDEVDDGSPPPDKVEPIILNK